MDSSCEGHFASMNMSFLYDLSFGHWIIILELVVIEKLL